jgi:hypothetical protein
MNELKEFFDECKKGEYGVMPYYNGQGIITFVWTNKKGYGRIAKLHLAKEGKEEAWKLYQEIIKLNDKSKLQEGKNGQ